MKNVSKYKVEASILIPIILFFIISLASIYATKRLLPNDQGNLWIKQAIWYGLGIGLAYYMMDLGNKFLYNNAYIFYAIGILLLGLVIPFGVTINNATCWFKIPFIGTIQPSEFMKVFLIIILSRMISDFNDIHENASIFDEFKFILKVLIVVFIPSVLTFIEPDTGAVIMYLIITFIMLFIGGLRKRWFILTVLLAISAVGLFLGLYFFKQDKFIDLFGTSMFYRMDRITNWSNTSGMQLQNSLTAIGSAGTKGHGLNKMPIYLPEMQNDFIFSVYASNTGLIGAYLLIIIIIYFDITLITYASKTLNNADKYAIGGIIGVLLFGQIYNIAMTIGLLPIMGITLPFISYGGSSLLSYMILLGIIFNVSNQNLRYTN